MSSGKSPSASLCTWRNPGDVSLREVLDQQAAARLDLDQHRQDSDHPAYNAANQWATAASPGQSTVTYHWDAAGNGLGNRGWPNETRRSQPRRSATIPRTSSPASPTPSRGWSPSAAGPTA